MILWLNHNVMSRYSSAEARQCRNLSAELKKIKKQGNLGDMRKIRVTRQFFEASDPQGHFFKEKKNFRYGHKNSKKEAWSSSLRRYCS